MIRKRWSEGNDDFSLECVSTDSAERAVPPMLRECGSWMAEMFQLIAGEKDGVICRLAIRAIDRRGKGSGRETSVTMIPSSAIADSKLRSRVLAPLDAALFRPALVGPPLPSRPPRVGRTGFKTCSLRSQRSNGQSQPAGSGNTCHRWPEQFRALADPKKRVFSATNFGHARPRSCLPRPSLGYHVVLR